MESTKMDLYAVQGYNLLTMRDRIIKITSDIDHATIAHNNLIARLQAELADLQNKVLEEGFVLTGVPATAKMHPKHWCAGDIVRRISKHCPSVYSYGHEYKVLAVRDGYIDIEDKGSQGPFESYCSHSYKEAAERFEFVK